MRERRGVVNVSQLDPVPADGSMVDPAVSAFRVSWEDESAPEPLEEAIVQGAEAAIDWGRERSPVVGIRLGNRGDTYFSAGDEHPTDGDPDEFRPHWPPDGPPPEGWWSLPPIPSREEVEAMARRVAAGEVAEAEGARWADDRLRAISHWEADVEGETLVALVGLTGDDPRLGQSEPMIRREN